MHDLRHSSASLALAQGIPIQDVSKRLGHSSIAITSDTYAHLYNEQQRAAAEAMDRTFAGAGRAS
jgi:integrase